jgi:hypothetical protein
MSFPGQKSNYTGKPSPHPMFQAAQRSNAATVENEVALRAPIPGLQRLGGAWGFCLKCLYEKADKTKGIAHNREGSDDPARKPYNCRLFKSRARMGRNQQAKVKGAAAAAAAAAATTLR